MSVLIRTHRSEDRLVELKDPEQFRRTMAAVPGNPCEVVIQVSHDQRQWTDAAQFWAGPYREDMPVPVAPDVEAIGRRMGARYARYIVRSDI